MQGVHQAVPQPPCAALSHCWGHSWCGGTAASCCCCRAGFEEANAKILLGNSRVYSGFWLILTSLLSLKLVFIHCSAGLAPAQLFL